jgi:hypothetical protein
VNTTRHTGIYVAQGTTVSPTLVRNGDTNYGSGGGDDGH